jgi:hypothetical protein
MPLNLLIVLSRRILSHLFTPPSTVFPFGSSVAGRGERAAGDLFSPDIFVYSARERRPLLTPDVLWRWVEDFFGRVDETEECVGVAACLRQVPVSSRP